MSSIFQTSSLNVVAWLLTLDFQIEDTKKINNQTIFYFERSNKLSEAIDKYNSNTELKKFIASFKKVKDIVKAK